MIKYLLTFYRKLLMPVKVSIQRVIDLFTCCAHPIILITFDICCEDGGNYYDETTTNYDSLSTLWLLHVAQ